MTMTMTMILVIGDCTPRERERIKYIHCERIMTTLTLSSQLRFQCSGICC